MTTRAAAAEATRERIVEVALEAFSTRWYDEVTLRGVARDAGVALQTVRNHFASKDELFRAAVERIGRGDPVGPLRGRARRRRRRDHDPGRRLRAQRRRQPAPARGRAARAGRSSR